MARPVRARRPPDRYGEWDDGAPSAGDGDVEACAADTAPEERSGRRLRARALRGAASYYCQCLVLEDAQTGTRTALLSYEVFAAGMLLGLPGTPGALHVALALEANSLNAPARRVEARVTYHARRQRFLETFPALRGADVDLPLPELLVAAVRTARADVHARCSCFPSVLYNRRTPPLETYLDRLRALRDHWRRAADIPCPECGSRHDQHPAACAVCGRAF